jgi:prepilin-type N-terminal cleavage/methylation domain-containing protein
MPKTPYSPLQYLAAYLPTMPTYVMNFRTRAKQGFTLVETLAVLAIVALVTALGAGMLHLRTGNPADAAQIVAAEVSSAQADAIATGMPARVILNIDTSGGAKCLRYVATLVQDAALTTSTTAYWKLGTQGHFLPEGTLFLNNSNYSTPNVTTTAYTMHYDLTNSQSQDGTTGLLYVYIQFDPTGQTSQNAQWVFEHGIENPDNSAVVNENKNDIDGFIVRRLGKLVYFREPSQIAAPTP